MVTQETIVRLSRDDILKAADNEPEEIDVPEWGGSVLVRGMTGRERDAFEMSMLTPGRGGRRQVDPANVRAKLVARCVIDDDGNRLFTDADVAELGGKSAAAVDRVYAVAARLSGMGGEEEMQELVRDFALGDGAGSSSTSPAGSARPLKGS
jgi:hypothetical protein